MIVFHASPNPSIKKLYDNSYVTIFPHIAYYMGLFHKNTGKTWTDDDLQIPYGFEEIIKFKKGRKPLGKPTLYYCDIDPSNIIIHQNFPFEFQVKKGCKVKIVNIMMYHYYCENLSDYQGYLMKFVFQIKYILYI